MELEQIKGQISAAFLELMERGQFRPGQIIVIGCSTSEVVGGHIGKNGSMEVAAVLYEQLSELAKQNQLYLAFQCCEHLNRALVVERQLTQQYHLKEVYAVPHKTAGGAMASHAYRQMEQPILVESIQAHGGLDIGETMIGMHLQTVAVPIRLTNRQIGSGRISGAITRPPLIGGQRAQYQL